MPTMTVTHFVPHTPKFPRLDVSLEVFQKVQINAINLFTEPADGD